MAKKKNNNVKQEETIIKDVNENTDQIKKFIIILVGVSLVAFLLYFVSNKYLIGDGRKNDTTTTEEISYSTVTVGNVFNRPYDEYYVLAYDAESVESDYYYSLINSFDTKKGKMFFLNLALEVNKKALGETSNKNAKSPNELKLKEPTLIKIKNGVITKYLETREEIDKEISEAQK